MKRHVILFQGYTILFHIAQGQRIEQITFESVFNLVTTISAESLKQLFIQVHKNYAVFYSIHFHAFLVFQFYFSVL